MTKKEWERQLKFGMASLPEWEQKRALEYYDELFAEKRERGMAEDVIVEEFGDPWAVARKIVEEYNADSARNEKSGDGATYTIADAPVQPTAPQNDVGREKSDRRKEREQRRREKEKRKNAGTLSGILTLLCVLMFFVLGACFNRWSTAWLMFLAIPVLITFVEAVERRRWAVFAYPAFAVLVFLMLGMYLHVWHPAWIIFLTIPLYYTVGSYISRTVRANSDEGKQFDESQSLDGEKSVDEGEKKGGKAQNGSRAAWVFVSIIFVCVIAVMWAALIFMLVGGIALIGAGFYLTIASAAQFSVGIQAGLAALGAGMAVAGVGMAFTAGIGYLFKPCKMLASSLIREMRVGLGKEERK